MSSLLVEMNSPRHGFERFRIKIVRRFNMKSDEIKPKPMIKPRDIGLSCVYIGREVTQAEVTNYLIEFFRTKGVWDHILSIRIEV